MAVGDANVLRKEMQSCFTPSADSGTDHVTNLQVPGGDESKVYRGPANRNIALVSILRYLVSP